MMRRSLPPRLVVRRCTGGLVRVGVVGVAVVGGGVVGVVAVAVGGASAKESFDVR